MDNFMNSINILMIIPGNSTGRSCHKITLEMINAPIRMMICIMFMVYLLADITWVHFRLALSAQAPSRQRQTHRFSAPTPRQVFSSLRPRSCTVSSYMVWHADIPTDYFSSAHLPKRCSQSIIRNFILSWISCTSKGTAPEFYPSNSFSWWISSPINFPHDLLQLVIVPNCSYAYDVTNQEHFSFVPYLFYCDLMCRQSLKRMVLLWTQPATKTISAYLILHICSIFTSYKSFLLPVSFEILTWSARFKVRGFRKPWFWSVDALRDLSCRPCILQHFLNGGLSFVHIYCSLGKDCINQMAQFFSG